VVCGAYDSYPKNQRSLICVGCRRQCRALLVLSDWLAILMFLDVNALL